MEEGPRQQARLLNSINLRTISLKMIDSIVVMKTSARRSFRRIKSKPDDEHRLMDSKTERKVLKHEIF